MSKREEIADAIIRKLKGIYLSSVGWEIREVNCNRTLHNISDEREKELQRAVTVANKDIEKAVRAQLKATKCGDLKHELYRETITISLPINEAVKEAIRIKDVAVKACTAYIGELQNALAEITNLRIAIEDDLILGGKYDTIIAAMAKKLNLTLPE